MNFKKINNVYLVGIGGIGMSALARYFKMQGKFVAGYDKTPSFLTDQLQRDGIEIHFEDDVQLVPQPIISQKENTIIIYTPAVPDYHHEFNYFIEREYWVMKRAEVLGKIFYKSKGIAVAGTHGKTTTSTMLAHILYQSSFGCMAFLGGISKNYNTNLLISEKSDIVVAEADEFDRSFLQLYPFLTIITSVDADHLDIYGSHEEVINSFNKFIKQIKEGGILIYKKGLPLSLKLSKNIKIYNYSINDQADFYPENIKIEEGHYIYNAVTPTGKIHDIKLGVSGTMNLENSIAALAAATLLDVRPDEIITALASFDGVKRRFEYHIKTPKFVYIDDYAHHPEEIKACIQSIKSVFPGKKITGIFQPHLFTRTRDFAKDFAENLSLLDELILLDIYPAREEPIPGITSEIIFKNVKIKNKIICKKEELINVLKDYSPEILVTMGAGDIDRLVDEVVDYYKSVLKIEK